MRLSVQSRLRGVDVAEHRLALAINGRERLLEKRLVPFSIPAGPPTTGTGHAQWGSVAIVGLGYVGLPTALALLGRASRITGFDVNHDRLRAIKSGDVDLSDLDRVRLATANGDERFQLTSDSTALADSNAVIVCVPTPVDAHHIPDLTTLQRACQTVVEHAHPGQTIILQSIHARPARVVERAAEALASDGRPLSAAKVIVVGVSYKAGVSDVRESPALAIIDGFTERGADVPYHDPLVSVIRTPQGQRMRSVAATSGADWDLAVIHVLHPRADDNCAGNDWIGGCPQVLDATYQFDGAAHGSVV